MSCNVKFKELSHYLDGRYTGRRKQDFEKHILECPHCKGHLDRLRSLRQSLHNLTPVEESEEFDFEFNRRLQERLNRRRVRIWNFGIEDILARIRDTIVYPVPVAVKVAVSFLLVITVVCGMRAQAMLKRPVVEFIAGDVKIYRPAEGKWVTPKVDMGLKPGDKIQSAEGAIFNIASRHMYKARIKDHSLIVISKTQTGWRNIDISLSISYGTILVNTTEKFKGSKMQIHTPACDAEVVGTAFMVRVIPELRNTTWLGVLEGKVKVISKPHPLKEQDQKKAVAYASSGQKTTVEPYSYPTAPELFSEKEWRMMQELYQLTEIPRIILLVGTEADRIEQLLKPAPVYIPDIRPRAVPGQIQNMVDSIIKATRENDYDVLNRSVKKLESLLERYPNPSYDVEILMFIASHYHYMKDYEDAIRVFEKVIRDYPYSQFASLAQCAVATIYQQNLKDLKKAEEAYRTLLEVYPDSIDAARAKEILTTVR